jgi:hypothetical protein
METDLGAANSSFKWRLLANGPSWTQTVGAISVSWSDETATFPVFGDERGCLSTVDRNDCNPVVCDVHHIANAKA